MANKNTKTVTRKRPFPPVAITVTNNIDARGSSEQLIDSLPRILQDASERVRSEIISAIRGRPVQRAEAAEPALLKMTRRFVKVSSSGHALADDAKDWEGVYDRATGLISGRKLLPGEANWSDSMKKAAAATLCGAPARAPTIQERLSIVDYERHSPALNTDFFDASEKSAWEWTSTKYASSPSDGAWGVYLGSGCSFWNGQSSHYLVRAVRAGQPVGL